MKNRIKVLFALPLMNAGGAERIVCTLLKFLDREKFSLILLLLEKKGAFLDCVPEDVYIYELKRSSLKSSVFPLIKAIRELKPDIVFSTIGSMNLLIASVRRFLPERIKFVARETNLVSLKNRDEKYPLLFDFLFKTVYKNFDLIICQSRDMLEDLRQNYFIPSFKMKIINNPVDIEEIEKRAFCESEVLDKRFFNVVAVGSLTEKKGFDLLIKALFLSEDKDIFLTIIGEGKEREKLQTLAKKLKTDNKIRFVGFKKNPYPYIKEADLLALSSRYEGFPNVLLEANALGVPVLAFRCKGGINEIVLEGINGWSVESFDIFEFAEKLEKIKRISFDKSAIKKSVEDRYLVFKIVKKYEEILENLYKG